MIKTEKQLLEERILENNYEFRKMFMILILIYMLLKVWADFKKFQSIFVACFVSIINMWVTKYIKWFSINFRLYIMHESKTQISDFWCKDLIIDFSAFVNLLDFFDEIDILTVRIVILTAYSTWAKKSLKIISMSYKKIIIETATNNYNEQTFFKVINNNNFMNDFEKSDDETFSENNDIINNNENKYLF